jgi:hypothetical protein
MPSSDATTKRAALPRLDDVVLLHAGPFVHLPHDTLADELQREVAVPDAAVVVAVVVGVVLVVTVVVGLGVARPRVIVGGVNIDPITMCSWAWQGPGLPRVLSWARVNEQQRDALVVKTASA